MPGENTERYTLSDAQARLADLSLRVGTRRQRIEIVPEAGGDACVLISKTELECLERALEILGDSDAVRDMAGQIAQLAAVHCAST
jgi:PHD/YefM family antitoxin component YafN of YafNO toxin-antitoxin module